MSVSAGSLSLAGEFFRARRRYSRSRPPDRKHAAISAGSPAAAAAAAAKCRSTAAVPEKPAELLLRGRPSSRPRVYPRRGCVGRGAALARRRPAVAVREGPPVPGDSSSPLQYVCSNEERAPLLLLCGVVGGLAGDRCGTQAVLAKINVY